MSGRGDLSRALLRAVGGDLWRTGRDVLAEGVGFRKPPGQMGCWQQRWQQPAVSATVRSGTGHGATDT